MPLFKRDKSDEPPSEAHARLRKAVDAQLPEDADEPTRRIVAAVAGLLGCVAYADREYSDLERDKVREELNRVHGLSSAGVEAICAVLGDQIAAISGAGDQFWTREIKELSERELRVEILEVLVDLAAADEALSLTETNYLRRLATALGLEQSDYDAVQARHRDKLSVLR